MVRSAPRPGAAGPGAAGPRRARRASPQGPPCPPCSVESTPSLAAGASKMRGAILSAQPPARAAPGKALLLV
jgi:hypothetical protein